MLERFESFVLCVLYILKSIPAALVRVTVSADAAIHTPAASCQSCIRAPVCCTPSRASCRASLSVCVIACASFIFILLSFLCYNIPYYSLSACQHFFLLASLWPSGPPAQLTIKKFLSSSGNLAGSVPWSCKNHGNKLFLLIPRRFNESSIGCFVQGLQVLSLCELKLLNTKHMLCSLVRAGLSRYSGTWSSSS